MRKVCVYTLGCRLNQCESEAIADSFIKEGYEIVKDTEVADLYIVNTCTVTSKAEQKARRMLRKFAQIAPVVCTGCYAQVNRDDIAALSSNIIVVPLIKKANLLRLASHITHELSCGHELLYALENFGDTESSVFDYDANTFSYHSRAYLKIQDGCDNECGYCRVRVARGKAKSLEPEKVIERALMLQDQGYSEIMLTGVNLTMYDHENEGLGGMLEKLIPRLSKNMRIRLSSMEADHVDDRLLDVLADYHMQPHFHIPVQSASDRVLKRVNRKYDYNHLVYITERMRQVKDDPFMAADVITGLPAEEDEDFEMTYTFFRDFHFSQLHVFPFSPRPDTALYHATDKVPEYVRDERAQRLRDLSAVLHDDYLVRQSGRIGEVILQKRKGGVWNGLTGNYVDVKIKNPPLMAREGLLLPIRFPEIKSGVRIPTVEVVSSL